MGQAARNVSFQRAHQRYPVIFRQAFSGSCSEGSVFTMGF
jgi:hypothetical protein